MQIKKTFAASALAGSAIAAYVPSEPWTTLTPAATYNGGLTDYASTFGIAVVPITTSVSTHSAPGATHTASAESKGKRDVAAISQIGDGQIQATTKTSSSASASSAAPSVAPASHNSTSVDPVTAESCKSTGTLEMTLKGAVLTDGKGRIGSIVANRQFQFDGPPPQAGAIYAKGWSLTPAGNLAIGDSDVFYQCLSGEFYNLYDESIGDQCKPVYLQAIDLLDC